MSCLLLEGGVDIIIRQKPVHVVLVRIQIRGRKAGALLRFEGADANQQHSRDLRGHPGPGCWMLMGQTRRGGGPKWPQVG
jgi:hypothetical protein